MYTSTSNIFDMLIMSGKGAGGEGGWSGAGNVCVNAKLVR